MNTSLLAGGLALILGLGLVISLGALSLLSGALHFLFARPKLDILKSASGENGFAFGLSWNSSREPARFDKVKLRLFNPFGSPTQVEVSKEFNAHGETFAEDVDMGVAMKTLLGAKGLDQASVEIEVFSNRDGISQFFMMKAPAFKAKLENAQISAKEFNSKHKVEQAKPLYQTVKRTFIAEPMPKSDKSLKIATNPSFAGDFSADAGSAGGESKPNFAVSKVWIEPGCIVCDACEGIYPEVFEVTSDTCIIRPDAPLNDGLRIQEAAEACPVEVIKFNQA